MNNLLNIRTPAEDQASELKSDYGLVNQGLSNLRKVYWNLPTESLYEEIIFRNEAHVAYRGPIIVNTGKHTARAASDKFIVREPNTARHIWWGEYNRPFSSEMFDSLLARLQGFLQGRDLFVQDCYGGADPRYRLSVRIITEYAWHSQFARNMFIRPSTNENTDGIYQILRDLCAFIQAMQTIDGTPSQTFIVINRRI
jgi:phosphoenolpyruvate carboxykinase (ATP)